MLTYIISSSSVHSTDDIFPEDRPSLPDDPALASREFLRRCVYDCFEDINHRIYYMNFIADMSDDRVIEVCQTLITLLDSGISPKEYSSRFFREIKTIS